MPIGTPVIGNSTGYLFGANPSLNVFILPGGMANFDGTLFMICAGWVAFAGIPPL